MNEPRSSSRVQHQKPDAIHNRNVPKTAKQRTSHDPPGTVSSSSTSLAPPTPRKLKRTTDETNQIVVPTLELGTFEMDVNFTSADRIYSKSNLTPLREKKEKAKKDLDTASTTHSIRSKSPEIRSISSSSLSHHDYSSTSYDGSAHSKEKIPLDVTPVALKSKNKRLAKCPQDETSTRSISSTSSRSKHVQIDAAGRIVRSSERFSASQDSTLNEGRRRTALGLGEGKNSKGSRVRRSKSEEFLKELVLIGADSHSLDDIEMPVDQGKKASRIPIKGLEDESISNLTEIDTWATFNNIDLGDCAVETASKMSDLSDHRRNPPLSSTRSDIKSNSTVYSKYSEPEVSLNSESQEERPPPAKKMIRLLAASTCLLTIGLVTFLGVALKRPVNISIGSPPVAKPTPAPTPASQAPSSAPTTASEGLSNLLESRLKTGGPLFVSDSPQSQAFDWLLSSPVLSGYSQLQRVQRYVLATVYYSTSGENWLNRQGWMSETNECSWFTSETHRPICNIAGELNEIALVSDMRNAWFRIVSSILKFFNVLIHVTRRLPG